MSKLVYAIWNIGLFVALTFFVKGYNYDPLVLGIASLFYTVSIAFSVEFIRDDSKYTKEGV
jgi:hypothetical protein